MCIYFPFFSPKSQFTTAMKPFIVFCKLPFFLFFLSFLLQHSHSQQSYVNNNQLDCDGADEVTNGYVCVNSKPSCVSYLTFRAQAPYDSASQIGSLLNADPTTIAQLNNITDVDKIPTNTLIIVPISNCSCSGNFYLHNTTDTLKDGSETYFIVANDTLQGLSTCQALMNANPYDSRNLSVGMRIEIPLRCACPTRNQIDQGFQFLLSYLVTRGDNIPTISESFGVDEQSTREANQLSETRLIFPFTTLLIPLKTQPTYRLVAQSPPTPSKRRVFTTIGIVVGSVLLVAFVLALLYLFLVRHPSRTATQTNKGNAALMNESQSDELELPLFDSATIATATDEFSFSNKIGQGGFGPVYKGILPAGEEIAIKRLSKDSQQGLQEFMNEVILIAKLQHRNLVRLLGCCIQGDDRMLIYEYMSNKSLDFFIFDQTRSAILNWKKRFDIIVGIARGLLYLHRDSRLRIIHRDLKAANVLLDSKMNPKISDFGLARTFGADQTEENTMRVVGTYGYMSPEYATDGLFSMKSDVFSFGVIVLEIVSGKRNRGFHHADHDLNLLGHTWTLLKDNRALEIMDASMNDSFTFSEGLKCIQVGLLCVQKFPEDRPSMSTIISMLDGDGTNLPYPKQPGFYTERSPVQQDPSYPQDKMFTKNEATITVLEGR